MSWWEAVQWMTRVTLNRPIPKVIWPDFRPQPFVMPIGATVTPERTLKERQLRSHFDRFVDRDARYPGYVLTDDAWKAFKKSESYGKKSLTQGELDLAAPLFGAKWSYEITIQSLWQELAEWWSSGFGWDAPLRDTIGHAWREGGNRVYLRALFKIRRSIKREGFIPSMMAYTGLSREDKARYIATWDGNSAKYLKRQPTVAQ